MPSVIVARFYTKSVLPALRLYNFLTSWWLTAYAQAYTPRQGVYDVVVVGRPSERWGSEVVAVVQFAEGRSASDDELVDVCNQHIARYKVPKAFIHTDKVVRSPAGKADYRWAKSIAEASLA